MPGYNTSGVGGFQNNSGFKLKLSSNEPILIVVEIVQLAYLVE